VLQRPHTGRTCAADGVNGFGARAQAAGATDAFQRMVQAYQNLLRFV